MDEPESERYTTAMLALGFACGLVMHLTRHLSVRDRAKYVEDIEWLHKQVNRVMQLNAEAAASPSPPSAA